MDSTLGEVKPLTDWVRMKVRGERSDAPPGKNAWNQFGARTGVPFFQSMRWRAMDQVFPLVLLPW